MLQNGVDGSKKENGVHHLTLAIYSSEVFFQKKTDTYFETGLSVEVKKRTVLILSNLSEIVVLY